MTPPARLRNRFAVRRLRTRLMLIFIGLFAVTLLAAAPAVMLMDSAEHATRTFDPLFAALSVIAVMGFVLMLAGSWILARRITRPISALDEAVHKLQRGEHAFVPVTSDDEIGRLAASFNLMVADLRDREARLTQMATHDQETGLTNRVWLEHRARQPRAWVILFSIDRFEVVRNAIGYDSMSRLLSALGGRLSQLAGGAQIARVDAGVLGLVVQASRAVEALHEARRLSEAAQAPVRVDGAPIDIMLTVGVARSGRDGADLDSAVDRAAVAVDQARAARRSVAAFDEAAYGDPGGNLSLISDLMTALRRGEVSLHYQPKYDFRARRVAGVEALMRWTHPTRGFVPPDLFIGMAEETGHIRALTEWCLAQAIADQRVFRQAGHHLTTSINISGRLMGDESFAEYAIDQVARGMADLCFEITETAVMDRPDIALDLVERFSRAGISVSLDDYGSGLSSLAYLKQIRADELKIDKAFVLGLDESARDALLVKSTIDLAHSLGLRIVAEGVETSTAMALLQGMGCDMAQGYFVGRPLPLHDMIAALDADAQPEAAPAARRA